MIDVYSYVTENDRIGLIWVAALFCILAAYTAFSLAVPWMLGQVVGGIIGAHILTKIKAAFVRKILIVLIIATSIKLVVRGLEGIFGIDLPVF